LEKVETTGKWERVRPLWEAVWQLLRTLCRGCRVPGNSVLHVHPDTCRPVLIAALFQIVKSGDTPKCISAQMGKQSVVQPYSGLVLSLKRKEVVPPAVTWGNVKTNSANEISQHKRAHAT